MATVGQWHDMTPTHSKRIGAWVLVITIVAVVGSLVWFAPVVAALAFVALTAFLAFTVGKAQGFWSGVRWFIKEILFGW